MNTEELKSDVKEICRILGTYNSGNLTNAEVRKAMFVLQEIKK